MRRWPQGWGGGGLVSWGRRLLRMHAFFSFVTPESFSTYAKGQFHNGQVRWSQNVFSEHRRIHFWETKMRSSVFCQGPNCGQITRTMAKEQPPTDCPVFWFRLGEMGLGCGCSVQFDIHIHSACKIKNTNELPANHLTVFFFFFTAHLYTKLLGL